jgi:hypothetical protein
MRRVASSDCAVGLASPPRPPRPRPPELGNIPPELKARCSWLCWRFSKAPNSQGKFGKVPYGVTDRPVNFTNRREWLPLDTAMRQYERGKYDGIGLVLGDGLCGLDEDHCIEAGAVSEEAARHIKLLNSYAELSVSGDGVHVLAYGVVPPGRSKEGNHELYGGKRYFVVTGQKLADAPGVIEHRESELLQLNTLIFGTTEQNRESIACKDNACPKSPTVAVPKPAPITQGGRGRELSDEAIKALVMQDPVARRYWSGCPKGVNHSEADFALACKLAFYSGRDLAQMERLFRQSGLASRAKANTRRGGVDYIRYNLQRACEKQAKTWEPVRRKSQRPPGRPRCGVDPQRVERLRSAGQSWREIARTLSIGTATAMRLYGGVSCVPKASQNSEAAPREPTSPIARSERPTTETGVPWAEWKAATLNRLFREQGAGGQPGHITAETVRHGKRKADNAKGSGC